MMAFFLRLALLLGAGVGHRQRHRKHTPGKGSRSRSEQSLTWTPLARLMSVTFGEVCGFQNPAGRASVARMNSRRDSWSVVGVASASNCDRGCCLDGRRLSCWRLGGPRCWGRSICRLRLFLRGELDNEFRRLR